MTVREWVDAALQQALHKASDAADYATVSARGALYGQQTVEYAWDYDDWDFKYATGSLTVAADVGVIAGPADLSIEGRDGAIYVSGQQREIVWIPGRELFAIRQSGSASGGYPEFYTIQEQSATYTPQIYFDRTSHSAFTGTIYYLKTRPSLVYVKAPSACTAALAGAGAGNVDNGAHTYKVTFVTASGETEGGTTSSAVTVADKTVNGQVALTAIPLATVANGVSDPSAVTSRKLYRTAAAGTQHKLLATLSDNTTTTYTDNIADSALGANVPTTDTTGDDLKKIPHEYHRSVLLPGLTWLMRENVGDRRAEVGSFPLFTSALARMREKRVFGLQEGQRIGDQGIRSYGMW